MSNTRHPKGRGASNQLTIPERKTGLMWIEEQLMLGGKPEQVAKAFAAKYQVTLRGAKDYVKTVKNNWTLEGTPEERSRIRRWGLERLLSLHKLCLEKADYKTALNVIRTVGYMYGVDPKRELGTYTLVHETREPAITVTEATASLRQERFSLQAESGDILDGEVIEEKDAS